MKKHALSVDNGVPLLSLNGVNLPRSYQVSIPGDVVSLRAERA